MSRPTAATPSPPPAAAQRAAPARLWRGWWWLLGLTLLWDWGGADLAVMQAIGSPDGFALRHQWLLSRVLHDAVRQGAVLFYVLVWLWAVWPARRSFGPAALWRLPRRERLTVALLVTLSLLAVNLIKNASQTSCPWDLQAFGGPAHYVSHWSLGTIDGGSGRCFPGGHASSAYAFVALCLPWLMPPAGQQRARTGLALAGRPAVRRPGGRRGANRARRALPQPHPVDADHLRRRVARWLVAGATRVAAPCLRAHRTHAVPVIAIPVMDLAWWAALPRPFDRVGAKGRHGMGPHQAFIPPASGNRCSPVRCHRKRWRGRGC